MNLNIRKRVEQFLVTILKIGHISIYIEGSKFMVFTTIVQNRKIVHSEHRMFDVLGNNDSPKVMKDFFKSFYDRVKYAYVSTFIDSTNQGVVQGCTDTALHELGLDMNSLVKVCIKDRWMVYTNIYEIDRVQERYKAIYGVDYIFPMEAIIEQKKPQDKENQTTLYMMNNQNSATLTIYKNNELLYSSHFLFDDKDDSLISPDDLDGSEKEEDPIDDDADEDLDNLDMDEEGLDDLEDMDSSMDDIEDLDDFVVEEDDDSDIENDDGSDEIQSEQDLKKELLLFDFVDNSLRDYYKNPSYKSDFITEAFILDTCKCSVGLKKHIKEMFFLEPKILSLDLGESLCELSRLEAEANEQI